MAGNNDRGGLGLGVVIRGVDQVSDLASCVGALVCCIALACLGARTLGEEAKPPEEAKTRQAKHAWRQAQ